MIKIGNYKIQQGDNVFYSFEEGIVKTIVEGRATDVKSGCIRSGGYDLMVVPITDETRKISRMYRNLKDDIRSAEGVMNLNWPDLSRYMENLWYKHCLNTIIGGEGSKEVAKSINKEFKKFSVDIFKYITRVKKLTVCNISLFR